MDYCFEGTKRFQNYLMLTADCGSVVIFEGLSVWNNQRRSFVSVPEKTTSNGPCQAGFLFIKRRINLIEGPASHILQFYP